MRRPRRLLRRRLRSQAKAFTARFTSASTNLIGYVLALFAFLALRGDSFASHASRQIARIGVAATGVGGYMLALCAFVALRCDSFASRAERVSREAARAVRARRRAWRQQPSGETTTSHLEWEGALVAAALAVVAVGYGGLLLATRREPARTSPVSVGTPTVAGLFPAIADATHTVAPTPAPAATPTPLGPPTEVRLRSPVVTAASLNAILRRTDARSLQHSFDDVRRETLAFHRCGMQMTATDRAMATCDGVVGSAGADGNRGGRRVRWTLDFQRTGGRWFIQRVAAR